MIQNYKIVTLCGSTRFKEQFLEAQKRLTLEGCIVISVVLEWNPGNHFIDSEKRTAKGFAWVMNI